MAIPSVNQQTEMSTGFKNGIPLHFNPFYTLGLGKPNRYMWQMSMKKDLIKWRIIHLLLQQGQCMTNDLCVQKAIGRMQK